MRRRVIIAGMLVGLAAVRAFAATNAVTPATARAETEACLARLSEIEQLLLVLEEQYAGDENRYQRDCVRQQEASLIGLRQTVQQVQARLRDWEQAPPGDDPDTAQELTEEIDRLAAVRSRAEVLLTEAQACAAAKPRRPRAAPAAAPRPRSSAPVARRPAAVTAPAPLPSRRNEQSCVRQGRLVVLLLHAAGAPPPAGSTPATCRQVLEQRGVAPPGGWQLDRCVTLDDFAVVTAQLMGLTGLADGDPAECLAALRVQGAPVDAVLPRQGATGTASPVLVEREVTEFLRAGWAGQRTAARD